MNRRLRTSILALGAALVLTPPLAAQDGPSWQIRLRGIGVIPDESATISAIGGDVDISNTVMPELDFTLFLTPNWALELILATTEHDVVATGTTLGDVDVGSVWLLPPTLTLQYHFLPDGTFRPYLGAGGNLTFFYSEDVPGNPVSDADYSTAGGFALQAGADIAVGTDGWFLNVDAKKIFLNTDVELNGGAITADVDIDPWVLSAGIGYRFR
ncbi:MAG: OmpW family outer membrane protein [Longimicrobiales bacterium]|nr:OmpW family outer membrane protein [Longimicrobiales bacterium]